MKVSTRLKTRSESRWLVQTGREKHGNYDFGGVAATVVTGGSVIAK